MHRLRRGMAGVAASCALTMRPLLAQGCSQCRDSVAQTSPGLQASYRVAIAILIAGAAVVCAAVLVVFRRMR